MIIDNEVNQMRKKYDYLPSYLKQGQQTYEIFVPMIKPDHKDKENVSFSYSGAEETSNDEEEESQIKERVLGFVPGVGIGGRRPGLYFSPERNRKRSQHLECVSESKNYLLTRTQFDYKSKKTKKVILNKQRHKAHVTVKQSPSYVDHNRSAFQKLKEKQKKEREQRDNLRKKLRRLGIDSQADAVRRAQSLIQILKSSSFLADSFLVALLVGAQTQFYSSMSISGIQMRQQSEMKQPPNITIDYSVESSQAEAGFDDSFSIEDDESESDDTEEEQ